MPCELPELAACDAREDDPGNDAAGDRDEPHQEEVRPEDPEEGRDREHLLGTAVTLPPEERAHLAVEHVACHEAPERFVALHGADRVAVGDDPHDDPVDDRGPGEHCQCDRGRHGPGSGTCEPAGELRFGLCHRLER